MPYIIIAIACAFIGLIIGNVITATMLRSRMSGSIIIDNSEPNGEPLLYLELTEATDELMNKKSAEFSIKSRNFISHK